MSGLPTGTVTFLFTDVEGSTRLAQELAAAVDSLRAGKDATTPLARARRAAAGAPVVRAHGSEWGGAW